MVRLRAQFGNGGGGGSSDDDKQKQKTATDSDPDGGTSPPPRSPRGRLRAPQGGGSSDSDTDSSTSSSDTNTSDTNTNVRTFKRKQALSAPDPETTHEKDKQTQTTETGSASPDSTGLRLKEGTDASKSMSDEEADTRAVQMQKMGATEAEIEKATGVDTGGPDKDKGDPGYVGDGADTNTRDQATANQRQLFSGGGGSDGANPATQTVEEPAHEGKFGKNFDPNAKNQNAAEQMWNAYWKREGDYTETRKRALRGMARAKEDWSEGDTFGATLNAAGAVGEGVDAGSDFVFDNPAYSVQEDLGKPAAKQFYEVYDWAQPDRTKLGSVPTVNLNPNASPEERGVKWKDIYVGEDRGKWTDNEQMSDKQLARRMYGSWEGTAKEIDKAEHTESLSGISTATARSNLPGSKYAAMGMDLVGMAPEIFIGDTGEAAITAGTGVNPETKEAEARPNSIDLVDIAGAGLSNIGKAGRLAGTGATGTSMSWADEIGKVSDDTKKAADDSANSGDTYTDEMDEFDAASSQVGVGDEYADYKQSVYRDIEDVGTNARKTGDDTSIDQVGRTNEAASGPDATFTVGGREYSTSDLMGTTDENVKATDETAKKSDGVSQSRRAEDAGSPTQASFVQSLNSQLPGTLRIPGASDEVAKTGDDTSSTADDTAKTGDETADDTVSANPVSRAVARVSSTLPGGRYTKIATAIGTFYVTAEVSHYFAGRGPDNGAGPGPNNAGSYYAREVDQFEIPAAVSPTGKAVSVPLWVTGKGQKKLGYNVILGPKKENGDVYVISNDGRPVRAAYIETKRAKKQADKFPKPVFQSPDAAQSGFQAWVDWLKNGPSPNGPRNNGNIPSKKSPLWSGSLTPPKAIRQGSAFKTDYTVALDPSGQRSASTRMVMALKVGGEFKPLASKSISLTAGPNAPGQTSGTLSVSSGTVNVAPGEYTLALAAVSQSGVGKIATDTLTVKPADDGSKNRPGSNSGSKWDDPQHIRAFSQGWHLFSQTKVGSNETRFMVVGRTSGGLVYLHKDGGSRSSPYFFPTIGKATTAFKRWAKAFEANSATGQSPNPGAGRPDPQTIKQDAAEHDSRQPSSMLSNLTTLADERPVMVGGMALGVVVVLVVARQQGWI